MTEVLANVNQRDEEHVATGRIVEIPPELQDRYGGHPVRVFPDIRCKRHS